MKKIPDTQLECETNYEKNFNEKIMRGVSKKQIQTVLETTTISQKKDENHSKSSSVKFRFSCTSCGNCCKGGGSVFFTLEELEKIYDYLNLIGKEREIFHRKLIHRTSNGYYVHENPGACYFLDEDNKCKVYPLRPLQCHTFPFWPSVFASALDFEATKKDCPGIQRGFNDANLVEEFDQDTIFEKLQMTHKKFIEPQTDSNKLFMI